MDVQMLGIGGLEATRRCLRIDPDVKIIAVTMHEDEPYPSKLLKVGVSGYITKKANMEEMVRAIRKVMAGERYISSDVAQQLALRPFNDRPASPLEQLSSREM
ncbi:MAG: response regulator [Pseudomonadales bacterium]|jgi:two-component system invasion response regulator UvrY|nr:response regulator [Pseudomonadales bacterium]